MAEPVEWRAGGVPGSARFGDIYHSEAGPLAQARQVFLAGCELPRAWAGQRQWVVLETGFGLGLSFLATWKAWRDDPHRPTLLHFVSIEAFPVAAVDLLRAAAAEPGLEDLAASLAARWHGLLPGFHRLAFDEGRVLLTLCVGDVQPMLRAQRFEADSIFLDGFSPDRNPAMWSPETLRAVARFARPGTRLATWTVARAVRDALTLAGFQVRKAPGLPPKRDRLEAVFDPAWPIRRRATVPDDRVDRLAPPADARRARRCAVVGAGLAGAAVAASVARRGWDVTVVDADERPAAGASGLPAGVLAPHVSPDDALLSRLTRAGIRLTWQAAEDLLADGIDWSGQGVLERRPDADLRLPAGWSEGEWSESAPASEDGLRDVGWPPSTAALFHRRAGWIRPGRLVEAWLSRPGVRFEGGRRIVRVEEIPSTEPGPEASLTFELVDADGGRLAGFDRVVIAAGDRSAFLAPLLPLQPVRGQIAWGRQPPGSVLPALPLNGQGHLLAGVPAGSEPGAERIWLAGSTFDRERHEAIVDPADTAENRRRLGLLHPAAAEALGPVFDAGEVHAWAGVRCASIDRRPLVGPADPQRPHGAWVCTAMGSRGLSFVTLCAELLAARWHGEPLPLPEKLAKTLDTRRLSSRPQNAPWPPATTSPTPPSTATTGR